MESLITKQFLENVLNQKIDKFSLSGGTKPGDNYLSILTSIEVVLADNEKPLYLLLKTFPNHPTRQKLLEESNLFQKEYGIYHSWIPELLNFQRRLGKNESQLLVPAMPELVSGAAIDYAKEDAIVDDSPLTNFLLMVDVRKTHGFQMANKLDSLRYPQVKAVLDELAKYHALGYAYKVHQKLTRIHSKFPFMEDPFFRNLSQRDMLVSMMKLHMSVLLKTCKNFLDERKDIEFALERFKDPELMMNFLFDFLNPEGPDEEQMEEMLRVKPVGEPLKEQWIVAGHGDCWTNNMLFKEDDTGNSTSAILVDLQCARECCITTDLVHFLYVSTDTIFRKQHEQEMVKWYYQQFLRYCGILKVSPFTGFTLENLQRKYHRSKTVGFLFAVMCYPIMLQRPESSKDMDNVKVEKNEEGKEEDWADMFQKMGRDQDDEKLMRDRFIQLLEELYDAGVL